MLSKAMESDSSDCDATCEGSPTQMCGGKAIGVHVFDRKPPLEVAKVLRRLTF